MQETFGSRIRRLRDAKGMTQVDMAKALSLANSTISQYEADRRSPDSETLIRLSDFFQVSVDYLLCRSNRIRADFSSTLPRLGTIHAGLPILAEENWDGDVDAPVEWRGDFALHIQGDSMSWVGIHEGDTAVLRQTSEVQHGMIVAAGIEDMEWTATLKFYIRENGQAYLRAANPAYEDILVGPGHRIIGQLVGVLKEPPSLQQYREHMASKDVSDCQWLSTIETATGLGLSGDEVRHMINLFAKVSRSGGGM